MQREQEDEKEQQSHPECEPTRQTVVVLFTCHSNSPIYKSCWSPFQDVPRTGKYLEICPFDQKSL